MFLHRCLGAWSCLCPLGTLVMLTMLAREQGETSASALSPLLSLVPYCWRSPRGAHGSGQVLTLERVFLFASFFSPACCFLGDGAMAHGAALTALLCLALGATRWWLWPA